MMVKALNIPVDEEVSYTGYADEAPDWLKPYLAAAMRSGLTAGVGTMETGEFGHAEPITGAEAAVMLQNAMDLAVTTSGMDVADDAEPAWAAAAVSAMNENGIELSATDVLTRGQVAQILYQVSQLAEDAPGLAMYQ